MTRYLRWLWLVLLPLLTVCGQPQNRDLTIFSRIIALAETVPGGERSDQAYVLDGETSTIYTVAPDGTTAASTSIALPPGGWPQTPVRAWLTTPQSIEFVVPSSDATFHTATFDIVADELSAWTQSDDTTFVRLINGMPTPVTGPVISLNGSALTLPTDVAAYPDALSTAGFVYINTAGELAWWSPSAATTTWTRPVSTTAGKIAYRGDDAAWTANGQVFWATVTADGATDIHRAPVAAAVIRLKFDPDNDNLLWLSTADAMLHRLKQGKNGRLCYIDAGGASTRLSNIDFLDQGRISDPKLRQTRVGIDGCPGWMETDEWTALFADAPPPWEGIAIGAATRTSDLPYGNQISDNARFRGSNGANYSVASTTPLTWSPRAPGSITGDLYVPERWTFYSERRGIIAIVASDQPLKTEALELVIRSGSDPPDTGDRFLFDSQNGVNGFSTDIAYETWEWFSGGRVSALDRQDNTLYIIAPTENKILLGLE